MQRLQKQADAKKIARPKRKTARDEDLNVIVRRWVNGHRKSFWKYEVSCFSRPYRISIGALPAPSAKDIAVSPNPGSMTDEKEELCETIRGLFDEQFASDMLRVDIVAEQIDGIVKTTVVHKGKPAAADGASL